MRPANACQSCRLHRRKCRAANVATPCDRCLSLKIRCSNGYNLRSLKNQLVTRPQPSLLAKSPASGESSATPTSAGSHANKVGFIDTGVGSDVLTGHGLDDQGFDCTGVDQSVVDGEAIDSAQFQEECVQCYFAHIHDRHHSLFHEPTIKSQLRSGLLPGVLLHSMVALGARFSNNPYLLSLRRRNRGQSSAKRAMALFNICEISVTTIQASILLGTICFAESRTEAEALFYAVANRLAQILDLAHRPAANEIERQVNLRIWWTLYMIDIWSSTGLRLPRQMQSKDVVELPVNEVTFLALEPRAHIGSNVNGIWGEMANLAGIWAEIYDLNRGAIEAMEEPQSLEESVETLLRRLEMWSAALPLHLRKTRSNFQYYASLGLGSAFAALHLGYCYYTQVLCYQFLAEDASDQSTSNHEYAERCKEHAKQFCDLLYMCEEVANCECLFVMVGHMLVVTSTVYIHTLVFSDQVEERVTARRRLEKNFRILMRLQSFWVKLDVSLSRLQAFHNACKISAEDSFGMDQWMLRFLLEHGVSVSERYPPIQLEAVADNATPGLTLQDWYFRTFGAV